MSVRHAILGLLQQQPRHGYELHAVFQALIGEGTGWDVKPPQVYTTLQRLDEAGMVEFTAVKQVGGPEQRIYEITDAGREELQEWLGSPVPAEHERDALYLKMMIALACAEETGGVVPTQLTALLRKQRARLYRELHAITARKAELDPRVHLAQMLLCDKAVMHLDADLRWLDMMEARLDEVAGQPLPQPLPRRRGRPPVRELEEA